MNDDDDDDKRRKRFHEWARTAAAVLRLVFDLFRWWSGK
jgi:hypothetical protein